MTTQSTTQSLSWADIQRWVDSGLISPQQAEAIRADIVEHSVSKVDEPHARPRRLNYVSIAYYFGAFMVLLAYTLFMGTQWESLSKLHQLAVAGGTMAGLSAMGIVLRRNRGETPGNLLLFVAAGLMPLLVYTIERWAGWWPAESGGAQGDLYSYTRGQWIVIEIASIIAAGLLIWLIRFPLVALIISFWTWFLSMDLVRWASKAPYWTWGTQERLAALVIGLGLLALGAYLQRRTQRDYSLWLYLCGHLIVLSHLSSLAFEQEGWWGLAFLLVSLVLVAASVVLQRRIFLVFGALGTYGYLCYVSFRLFENSLGWTWSLASMGLGIVLLTWAYQRWGQPWLQRMLPQYV